MIFPKIFARLKLIFTSTTNTSYNKVVQRNIVTTGDVCGRDINKDNTNPERS